MSQRPIQRIAVLVSVVSFFGSTAFGAVGAFNSARNQPTQNPTTDAAAVESPMRLQQAQLQLQEREYEVVLKQEPENQVALQGLVEVRLQMKNEKGAIEPLNQLVQLNPGKQEYRALLAQVKQQVGKGEL
ncbi:tetratricopeptide repeat protein [Chroococcidiopsis sp. CCMEE 29]|uniref:tetratricopeptide repeat protein n=1 Tax=Chroococcidiopsis sp. CCMEE 29 TaxID=155894 RepID=UPI0020216229|nr:tetratricopeptide repeat protein [Chroococcidiopsis sp. CCMEE 29]